MLRVVSMEKNKGKIQLLGLTLCASGSGPLKEERFRARHLSARSVMGTTQVIRAKLFHSNLQYKGGPLADLI